MTAAVTETAFSAPASVALVFFWVFKNGIALLLDKQILILN